jgi:hypothetical protein
MIWEEWARKNFQNSTIKLLAKEFIEHGQWFAMARGAMTESDTKAVTSPEKFSKFDEQTDAKHDYRASSAAWRSGGTLCFGGACACPRHEVRAYSIVRLGMKRSRPPCAPNS